ncbi:hypothetical protein LNN31_16350 [Acetobacterium wieringae]|uniref:Cation diffusion facilitator family transporter n=1 Tax=Acetobacterium wieringae TaxID=52694 RepID=A0ABY6HFJ1_9FIRM|nr:hypothetical protein [Acetobacterium wieringae]UYO62341.1 hypothetical protein LNN31_16350 [Acetobacterium wieringae]VUZ23008.1 Uncharacterised protein [Acetobacterium wieringae]
MNLEITKYSSFINDDFQEFLLKKSPIEETVMDSLFETCKKEVAVQIISQFGLSQIYDNFKDGGNVTTMHNAQKGVFSDNEIKERFEKQYDQSLRKELYEKDFKKIRKDTFQQTEGSLVSDYTGKELTKDGRTHLDHVVSAAEIQRNDEARLYMNDCERGEMAVDKKNLAWSESSLNQSKSDKDLKEWMETTNKKDTNKSNKEYYSIDEEKANVKHDVAKEHINATIKNKKTEYFKENIKSTSVNQGFNMAKKQAIGIIVYEFTNEFWSFAIPFTKKWNSFENMKERFDYFKEGIAQAFQNIKSRISRIFKSTISGFADGFVGGIISNIVTVAINTFATTLKSFAKILNDGVNGIIRAVKMLIHKPEGMTKQQSIKEVIKILSTTIVISVGVILTEAFSGYLKTTPFAPFSDIIASVIGAVLTAIVSATLVYSIDNIGKIVGKIGEAFSDIKYGIVVSNKEITERYNRISQKMDEIYCEILKSIRLEYEKLNRLTELAYDCKNIASIQFGYSVEYARASGVKENDILKSKQEIDNYFLN